MRLLPDFELPVKPYETKLTKLKKFWFQPSFHGMSHITETPSMFVGNRSLYGIFDLAILREKIYNEKDIYLRVLVDKARYEIPYWQHYIEANGGFLGTRELCSQAMERGDHLLLFPGGGREVMKRDGEAYKLIWKERLGFVKMAAQYNYPIQPFASIGADEAFSILLDSGDFKNSPLTKLVENTSFWGKLLKYGDEIPPISRGVALSPIPRPEPFFFIFGEPIDTSAYRKKIHDDEAMMELRDKVEATVEALIKEGKMIRANAPRPTYWRRLLNKL